MKTEKAIFASGCFWGTEYYFSKEHGVISTMVGYTGGNVDKPSYEDVSRGKTGHVEAVEVKFDTAKISYEALAKLFFETHDSTQRDGQGPDIGIQYKSVIFYLNESQKDVAEYLIDQLRDKGVDVATELRPATKFYLAEQYHQKYYDKSGGSLYCHVKRKLF